MKGVQIISREHQVQGHPAAPLLPACASAKKKGTEESECEIKEPKYIGKRRAQVKIIRKH